MEVEKGTRDRPRRFHTKGTKAQIWPRLWWPSRKNFTTWSVGNVGGEGGGGKRNRENERARVRDKAARLSPVCVPRIRVPRPWNTFTGFTANRHVYTMLIIRRSRWYPFTNARFSLLAYHDPVLVGRSTSFQSCRETGSWNDSIGRRTDRSSFSSILTSIQSGSRIFDLVSNKELRGILGFFASIFYSVFVLERIFFFFFEID